MAQATKRVSINVEPLCMICGKAAFTVKIPRHSSYTFMVAIDDSVIKCSYWHLHTCSPKCFREAVETCVNW